MLDDEANVITAVVDCPGVSLVPSLSRLKVINPFAVVGFQVFVERLNVNDVPVPMFLTYTVLVMLSPGVIEPQSIAERGVLQLLSEYNPKFAVTVTEPFEDKLLLTEIAP